MTFGYDIMTIDLIHERFYRSGSKHAQEPNALIYVLLDQQLG
jgi:hypothetical protein